jgi:hypothetical protein
MHNSHAWGVVGGLGGRIWPGDGLAGSGVAFGDLGWPWGLAGGLRKLRVAMGDIILTSVTFIGKTEFKAYLSLNSFQP